MKTLVCIASLVWLAFQPLFAQNMPGRIYTAADTRPLSLRSITAPEARIEIAPTAADLAQAAAADLAAYESQVVAKARAQGLQPPPQPLRIGSVFAVTAGAIVPDWESTADAGSVTHLVAKSAGATGIRAEIMLPAGLTNGEIRVVGQVGDTPVTVPLSVADNGVIWTPYTEGDTQIIELFTRQKRSGVKVAITRMVHFEASLATAGGQGLPSTSSAAGTCTVDVACSTGNSATDAALLHARRSVARLSFVKGSGSFVCTGTLINSQQYPAAFFLTANHCISTAAEASSIATLWFYYAATCGGARPAGQIVGGGAQVVYTNHMADSTLLKLNLAPPSGAEYAGWDSARVNNGDAVVSVSHPQGDIMKFALGTLSYPGANNGLIRIQGYPYDMYSVAFSRGIIEGGSSGSGLFTMAGGSLQLRGILSGTTVQNSAAGMSCTNTSEHALYGRFEVFYPEIEPYLDNIDYPVDDYPNQPDPAATTLPLGGSLNATFERAGDLDVFKIVIKQSGTLTLGSSGAYDTVGTLLNPDGSCFKATDGTCDTNATNDDGANNASTDNNFRLDSLSVVPGTYYLQVGMWDPAATTPNGYQVYAKFKPDSGSSLALSERGGIDLDGNGKSALVLRAGSGTSLAGRLVNNQFVFTPQVDPGPAFRLVGIGDFDANGKSDLAFLDITQGATGTAHIWNDYLALNDHALRTVNTLWQVQAVGDLDGDGYGDLVWRYTGTTGNVADTGVSYVWFSNGTSITQVRKRGGAPLNWTLMGALDLNGDGAADMIYVSPANQIRVLMATANRTCANVSGGLIPDGYSAVKFADFTGYGRGDILIRKNDGTALQLLSLDASSLVMPPPSATPDDPNAACTGTTLAVTTQTFTLPAIDPSWQFFAAGDFNGDGVTDIVWLQPNGTLTVWLMKTGGAAPTIIANAGTAPSGYSVFQP